MGCERKRGGRNCVFPRVALPASGKTQFLPTFPFNNIVKYIKVIDVTILGVIVLKV